MTGIHITSVIVVIVLAILTVITIRRRQLFWRRGWEILPLGRDEMEYVERGKGRFSFYAELMGTGSVERVIYLPSSDEWNSKLPSWAHDRRDDIIARIKTCFPEPKFEYRNT